MVDGATVTIRRLVAIDPAEHAPRYSPDGRSIAFMRSDDPPSWAFHFSICVVPATGGEPRQLAESFDAYPHLIGWSADGGKLYYTESHGTLTRLCALPLDGKAEVVAEPPAVIGSLHLNSRRSHAGFSLQSLDRPAEAHVASLEHFAPVAVSRAHQELSLPLVPHTEVVHWKSSDGREIEGLLTVPADYQEGKRCPMVLIVHGGPMGVFSQSYLGVPSVYG